VNPRAELTGNQARQERDMATTPPTGAPKRTTLVLVRLAWGTLGALLLIWDVLEAVLHAGWVIPAAVLGAAVPGLARLAGLGQAHAAGRLPLRAARLVNLLHHPLPPFALMVVFPFLGGSPEDNVAPFTFGMSWLTSIALTRARGHGLRAPGGRPH